MPNSQNIDSSLDDALRERFFLLPKVVQRAIQSADVQKNLRGLADIHKLHLDQWQSLENEVMLTLLGVEHVENLAKNLQKEVGVTADVALSLAKDIGSLVFEPIRQKLERELEHPDAAAEVKTAAETARTEILDKEHAENASAAVENTANPATVTPPTPVIQPATPPQPMPDIKVARPSESTAYKPGEASHERKNINDDPYREQIS